MTQKQKLEILKNFPASFEDILEHLGGFGKFQVFVTVILATLDIPNALISLQPAFIGANPAQGNCNGIPVFYKDFCKCNGTLSTSSPYTSFVSEWYLFCGSSWVSDSITSIQMSGSFVSSLVASQMGDWYGRRIATNAICITLAIGTALSAIAPNVYIFALARFLVGAGTTGMQGLATVYVIEFMPVAWRPLPTAVRPYGEATMVLGILAYYFRPWRTLVWVSGISIFVVLCIMPLVPESPRWLLQNGKIAEAQHVLRRIAKMNGQPELEENIIQQIAEKEMGCNQGPVDESGNPVKVSYMTIFNDPELRKRAICLMIIWFCWVNVGFGLALNIKNTPGNPYLNMIYLGIADTLGAPSSFLIMNRLGRRVSLILTMSLGAIFLIILAGIYLTLEVKLYLEIILILYILAKFSMAVARAALRCHSAELFPTPVRSMGSGLCGISLSLGAVIFPQFIYLGASDPAIPLFAFAILTVTGALVTFFLPETEGKRLEDTVNNEKQKNPIVINS